MAKKEELYEPFGSSVSEEELAEEYAGHPPASHAFPDAGLLYEVISQPYQFLL